jgi:hypothetical protein
MVASDPKQKNLSIFALKAKSKGMKSLSICPRPKPNFENLKPPPLSRVF